MTDYKDVSTAESRRNDLAAEEFPEGPYGLGPDARIEGKSSPWRDGQRAANPFSYENKALHEGIPRDYPAEDAPEL